VPRVIANGAAGGAGLAVLYRPLTAVTVQVWPAGAFTTMVSSNWPLVRVVALFLQTQGSLIATLQLKVETATEPVILPVQPPAAVATTV
jgi:hypothetical protein